MLSDELCTHMIFFLHYSHPTATTPSAQVTNRDFPSNSTEEVQFPTSYPRQNAQFSMTKHTRKSNLIGGLGMSTFFGKIPGATLFFENIYYIPCFCRSFFLFWKHMWSKPFSHCHSATRPLKLVAKFSF